MRSSDWSSDVCSSDLTRCHQHRIGGDRLAIVEVDEQRAVRLFFDRLEGRVEAELDALGHRDLQQAVADLLVIAAQDRIAAVDDRHLAAKFVEDAGELVGDIAAACDDDPVRQGIEVKNRSEEHTSELQSLMRNSYAVFCLKKKKT